MQALGLIETRGLLVAVESADAMLKAADVTLLEKTYVGGGLVSIAVTGGVAAVKASVEAGAAAVKKINAGLLVSQHVIPRPHEEVNDLFGSLKPIKKVEMKNIESVRPEFEKKPAKKDTSSEKLIAEEILSENAISEDSPIDFLPEETISINLIASDLLPNDSITEDNVLDKTEIKETISRDLDLDKMNKDYIDHLVIEDGLDKALKVLSGMKVTKLRSLAREYVILRIAGRAISKADKKMLMKEFEQYYKKNKV